MKFKVWTEGLDEMWFPLSEAKERIDREILTAEEVAEAIENLHGECDASTPCLFILEAHGQRLRISLNGDHIEASNPEDRNYQNVTLQPSEICAFLEDYFALPEEEEETRRYRIRIIEWVAVGIALLGLVFTVQLTRNYLEEQSYFTPKPEVVEIEDKSVASSIITNYTGVYVSELRNSGLAIELKKNQEWAFYDIRQSAPGKFTLEPIHSGAHRAAYSLDKKPIIVTDTHFTFSLNATLADGVPNRNHLVFQQRLFKKIAATREDLPHVQFPAE